VATVLSRLVRKNREILEYKANPRQAEKHIDINGMEGSNSV